MSETSPVDQCSGELPPQKLRALGVLWPAEVDRICDEETHTQFLVENFLPAKSIAIVAGDSTIGKSPLLCQLALCVAAGVPFLGMKTNQSRVLYFDLENSLSDCKTMRDALVQFLYLGNTPRDFLLRTEPQDNLAQLISEITPGLVVIDSLRSFRPEVTEKNPVAGEWLKEIRKLARKYACAFVLVHHLRKPGEGAILVGNLAEETRVADWLLEMEGPRALVNQTDVRVAVAEGDGNPAALKLKWSRRVHGDSPLVLLDRVFDGDGDPRGYQHLTGAALLSPDQQQAYAKLPAHPTEFTFKDAKQALGQGDNRTGEFLSKGRQVGVIEKLGKNRYRKIVSALAPSSGTLGGGVGAGVVGVEAQPLCSQ